MKRQFVIDCDTGTDDAIAILAAYGADIDIKGITSVNGNVGEEYVSQNNLDLVEYLGFDTPVVRGAKMPLLGGKGKSDGTHGITGLGPIKLPNHQKLNFNKQIASAFIYDEALKANGELEILAIGPLTNIALALIQYPNLNKLIKHLWVMGGAVIGGNVSTTAEFNIWIDPEAAHTVFKSGIPITLAPLDITLKANMLKDDELKLREKKSKANTIAADLLAFMFERYEQGGEDALMHDACALALALNKELFAVEKYYMDVECTGTYTRGHTYADVKNKTKEVANIEVALKIDTEGFRKWLIEKINNCPDN